jgi:hypothetical protein
MNAIGGYFELESSDRSLYHDDAVALNTGRNAFEYILQAGDYSRIFIPEYTCNVLLQPLLRLGLPYQTYSIDSQFEPDFNYAQLTASDAFLYTNYYGLKDHFISGLASQIPNLIIDNAQAFFSKPDAGFDAFYSARKFFGVPDGGFAYVRRRLDKSIEKDESRGRIGHLMIRAELDAESGYASFAQNEDALNNNPVRRMSALTERLLKMIDYEKHAAIRRRNYLYLQDALQSRNGISLPLPAGAVPMTFPYLDERNESLRQRLIEQRIYVARYWPEVLNLCSRDSVEYRYAAALIPLPIDQRTTIQDLDLIIKTIKNAD